MIETPKVGDQSLIYMYGISDFWADIFGDTELVEAVLASSTIGLGEVYSYFLQRSAGISLADIGERYETRIKLLLLDESDALDDDKTTFPIDPSIEVLPKLANRPILPSQVLEGDVHYEVIDGTIRFVQPVDRLKFATRYKSGGGVQYALWMVDVEIDEKWIDNSFGRLVGFTEDDAIFNYKSFLEGVYYLYSNGPNISFIERGVNLAMGMPYARASEIVLDIQQDAETGNWVIFTETQSYEMPYGYRPDFKIGHKLVQNNVLSTWVQVRDWVRDGEWWYDVYLPQEVLGKVSTPRGVGKCTPGSTGDKMMQTFLKHHMFEVLITQANGDEGSFNTARNLVLYSKPEYTYPIFVWRVPVEDEIIHLEDDLQFNLTLNLDDTCIAPPSIRYMDRGREDSYFYRGRHWYNRFQGSMYAATLLGYGDWPGNAGWSPEFSSISDPYFYYLEQIMRTRGDVVSPINRGTITRGWRGKEKTVDENGQVSVEGLTWSIPSNRVWPKQSESFEINDRNLTPLYMMSTGEMIEKIKTLHPRFTIRTGDFNYVLTGLDMPSIYDQFMVRNQSALANIEGTDFEFINTEGGLDINFSPFANQAYVPKREDMYHEDGAPITDGVLFFSKNTRSVWTVQWVRYDISTSPTIFPVEDPELLQAIEVYDQGDIGRVFEHRDKYIGTGQQSVLSPVIIGQEGFPLVTIGDYYLPSYAYDVAADGINISLIEQPMEPGNVSWIPWLAPELILPAGGDLYIIPETITDRESIMLAYSPVTADYEFLHDYTVAVNVDGTTSINLSTALPVGGDLIVIYADHGSAPVEEIFTPAGNTYTIQAGYTVKIFSEGRVLNDREYSIVGTQLSMNVEPTVDFRVRYYPTLSYELQSSFNRSTVQRNEARFLMDRGRLNGEYDDLWDDTDSSGTPNVYINRGGRAWLEVPELGETPVYADSVNVVRRLR